MRGQVDDNGVVLAGGRRLGWDHVYYVDWTASDARLATAAGVVTVSRADGDRAEQAVAPWEAERDAWAREASEARRRDWAGLTSTSSLTSRQGWGYTFLVGFLWLIPPGLLLGALASGDGVLMAIALILGLMLGPLAVYLQHRTIGPNITRDAAGLRFGGLRSLRLKWAELRASGEVPMPTNDNMDATHLVLLTRRGRLVVRDGYKDGEAMRLGLRRALAERDAAVPATARGGLFAASLGRPGQGLWLDDSGLTMVGARGVRRVSWARLKSPVWGIYGPVLDAGGRKLRLLRYQGGEALAQAVDHHLADEEPIVDERGELRAEAIERWLGVKPGGALSCRLSPALVWGCGLFLLMIAVGFVLVLANGDGPHGNFYQLGIIIAMFFSMLGSARAVDADAKGLSIRRGKRRDYYAWSEIVALKANRNDWTIITERGNVKLSRVARGQDRVVGIIRRILSLRDQGAQLPDAAPTPEVALSLARDRGDQQAAERGLSVSGED